MKKTKKVECEKLDEVVCDICGQSCKKTCDNEFASLTATWGYDSKNKDLLSHNIDLCEGCFDKTIEFLRQIRTVPILTLFDHQREVTVENDPLDGVEYGLT